MSAVFTPTRARLSVDQFHRMAEAGIFASDDRVELINGEMIEMAPIGSRHSSAVMRLRAQLGRLVGELALVSPQNPVMLPPDSEPQPDIALLKPRADWYSLALPGPADVLLVVEVADTTVDYDRDVKLALYAAHGIREAWIVDLRGRRLEVYRDPRDGHYRMKLERGPTDMVSPEALPAVALDLSVNFM